MEINHGDVVIPIPGELVAVDSNQRVTSAAGVYDYNLADNLEVINSRVNTSIGNVQTNIQNLLTLINLMGDGGTTDYTELTHKPSINGVELLGNLTLEDLNIPDYSQLILNLSTGLGLKANTTDVYTKGEVDGLIHDVEDLIEEGGNFNPELYYTITDIDGKGYLTQQDISGKANISDVYTKGDVYNTTLSDTLLNAKANVTDLTALLSVVNNLPKNNITVDSTLSSTSTNPVLNQVINGAITNLQNGLQDILTGLNNKLSGSDIKKLTDNQHTGNNAIGLTGSGNVQLKTINGKSIFVEGNEYNISVATEGSGDENVIEAITVNGSPVSISGKTATIEIDIPELTIESISVNGSTISPNNGNINITVPTDVNQLSDTSTKFPSQLEKTSWNKCIADLINLTTVVDNKQSTLVSGENIKTINNLSILGSGNINQVQSDWNQTNSNALDYIKNKPTIPSVSNVVTLTGNLTINGTKTFLNNPVATGLEHTNSNSRSYNNIWTTNGSYTNIEEDILRVYYYDGEELKPDEAGGMTVSLYRLLTDPEIYNTLITDENNLVYYAEYVDPELTYVRFRSIDNNFLLTITKDLSVSEGYTIVRTEIENTSGESSYSGTVDTKYLTITSLEDNNRIYFITLGSLFDAKTIEFSDDNGRNWHSLLATGTYTDNVRYSDEYGEYTYLGYGIENILSYSGERGYIELNEGEKLIFRGNNSEYVNHHFLSNKKFKLSGNIMSLCYSETFGTLNNMTSEGTFSELFKNCFYLTDAGELTLPSTVLSKQCYAGMFENCSSLTIPPRLIALTLNDSCYSRMFEGCIKLEIAPDLPALELSYNCYSSMFRRTKLTNCPILPATKLAIYCYSYMFAETPIHEIPSLPKIPSSSSYEGMFMDCTNLDIESNRNITFDVRNSDCCRGMFMGCTSLTKAPKIESGTVGQNACYSMFEGCISLTTAPELSSMTLLPGGSNHTFGLNYAYMFKNCTSLTEAPELPATELTMGCYLGMFYNCTSLTKAPSILPAITFTDRYANYYDLTSCYEDMFYNCINLVKAPELPALILTLDCYKRMFYKCSSLNYIKCLATDISATDCTYRWVDGEQTNIDSTVLTDIEEALTNSSGKIMDYVPGTNTQYVFSVSSTNAAVGIDPGGGFDPFDESTWPEDYKKHEDSINPDYNFNYYNFVPSGWFRYSKIPALDSDKRYNYIWASKREFDETKRDEAGNLGMWGAFLTPLLFMYLSPSNSGVAPTGTFVKGNANWGTPGGSKIPINWDIEIDSSLRYLTLEILTNGDIEWKSTNNKTIQYSNDDGETWNSFTPNSIVTVDAGDRILLKGNNTNYYESSSNYSSIKTSSGATFNLYGNIMSLVYEDDFIGRNDLGGNGVDSQGHHGWYQIFRCLFRACEGVRDCSNLLLPATILSDNCYREMFSNSGITKAPRKLPALSLLQGCYYFMFQGCENLTTVPELPATTLAIDCYSYMFSSCNSLTGTPLSELPATNLKDYCYSYMFLDSEGITTSPKIYAKYLAGHCYEGMFQGCINLNKIICDTYYNEYNNADATSYWVQDVASSGTFVTSYESSWPRGDNGIPTNWTVLVPEDNSGGANSKPWGGNFFDDEQEYYADSLYANKNFFTMEILTDGNILWKTDNIAYSRPILYKFHYGEIWNNSGWTKINPTLEGYAIPVKTGDIVLFRGDEDSYTKGYEYNHFDSTAQFNISGNIKSLVNGGDYVYDNPYNNYNNIANYAFKGLFKNCHTLISASKAYFPLPSKIGTFELIFLGCINLIDAPYLGTSSTASYCYASMFENCISLNSSPRLPASTLTTGCYNRMFYGCKNLNNIICIADTNVNENNTTDWVVGVSETGVFNKANGITWSTGTSGIPEGWTVQ